MKKIIRRFVLLAIVSLAVVFVQYNYLYEEAFGLEKEEELAEDAKDQWNKLMAAYANKSTITLQMEDASYTSLGDDIYVSNQMDVMIPVDLVRECFDASAHIYNQKKLVVTKKSNRFCVKLQADFYTLNGGKVKAHQVLEKKKGTFYVSARILAKALGYNYTWKSENNSALIAKTNAKQSLPEQYDLRKEKRTGTIRNQGSYGTCWAFAALSCLESTLLPEQDQEFSVDHMSISNSFATSQYEGGDYTMGMAYLAAWQGPVAEKDDPYGDGKSKEDLQPLYHVQEMQLIGKKEYDKIKEAVMLYGGVQTSIYNSMTNGYSSNGEYSYSNKAYYYDGKASVNHDIVIVGWDDNYSKENFTHEPEGNGAFICQNSWGRNFGEDGFFYVSYYDTNIGTNNVVYTKVEDADNYANIYQSDLCGWVGQIGYGQETIYGANVYEAKEEESLCAAGFYVTSKQAEYELYAVANYEDTDSLADAVILASGKMEQSGYYTVEFLQKLHLQKGKKFALVLKLTTPGNEHPLAIEYRADKFSQNADLTDGKGYISSNGKKWVSLEETYSSNLCLKAYTR